MDLKLVLVFLLPMALGHASSSSESSEYGYYRYLEKDYDFFGEYYKDTHGFTIYIYCYDPRNQVENRCRPGGGMSYNSYDDDRDMSSQYPDFPGFIPSTRHRPRHDHQHQRHRPQRPHQSHGHRDEEYSYYDGRGNINVGRGNFYWRGRDMYIECDFNRRDNIVSNILWFRKSFNGYNDGVFGRGLGYRRYRVERVGRSGSRLIIRDYTARDDDGVYRCFATRQNYRSYQRRGKETVYKEVEVYARGRSHSYGRR